MLSGRMPVQRGAKAILGCCILFCASTTANGLLVLGRGESSFSEAQQPPVPTYKATTPRPLPYDPYAGASVPAQLPPNPGVIR